MGQDLQRSVVSVLIDSWTSRVALQVASPSHSPPTPSRITHRRSQSLMRVPGYLWGIMRQGAIPVHAGGCTTADAHGGTQLRACLVYSLHSTASVRDGYMLPIQVYVSIRVCNPRCKRPMSQETGGSNGRKGRTRV
jgi:hypothetical protein